MTSTLKRSVRTMPLRDLSAASAVPVASVHANLMPPEVIAKRRLHWLRRRLSFALVALVALVGCGYALARQETGSSQDELASTQSQTVTLGGRVTRYDQLLAMQARTAELRGQLASVMTTDLQWSRLLASLNTAAPPRLRVTQVAGTVSDPTAAAAPGAATGSLDPAVPVVGTLTLTGEAADYRTVARFVDTLGAVRGITQVAPGSVVTAGSRTTFTITLSLTKDVLGGRFTKPGGN